jgi:hypothetical protein
MSITKINKIDSPTPSRGEPPFDSATKRRGGAGAIAWRAIRIRLRFPLILAAGFLVVGRWEFLRNHWDRLTRRATGNEAIAGAVSNDTEYFCPMDPGVVAEWPGRCGVCNMALVRRKKGDAAPLPEGVLARMKFSPDRVQLAGIRTSPVRYLKLSIEIRAFAIVHRSSDGRTTLAPTFRPRDAALLHSGLAAEITSDDLPGRGPFEGKVDSVDPPKAVIVVNDPKHDFLEGMTANALIRVPVDEIEPFRSLPADPPPLRVREARGVYACVDHPATIYEKPGRCVIDQKQLEFIQLNDFQRLEYWCPMHPEVKSNRAGDTCSKCGGMRLQPRVVSYRPKGTVPAIPESAIVDDGVRKIVYVESMPGMFDAVEVVVGPRCGEFYPIVRGLDEGRTVATAGAFLLDAETRLNPAASTAYFGATRTSSESAKTLVDLRNVQSNRSNQSTIDRVSAIESGLAELSLDDRKIAIAQRVCPVTHKPLGSMGTPFRVVSRGRVVFLCCDGCEAKFQAAEKKRANLPELGADSDRTLKSKSAADPAPANDRSAENRSTSPQ